MYCNIFSINFFISMLREAELSKIKKRFLIEISQTVKKDGARTQVPAPSFFQSRYSHGFLLINDMSPG